MLREVARRRAEIDAENTLFHLGKDETEKKTRNFEEQRLVEEHNLTRERLHFEKGWPWEELPTARTMLKATKDLLLTEPFVHIGREEF